MAVQSCGHKNQSDRSWFYTALTGVALCKIQTWWNLCSSQKKMGWICRSVMVLHPPRLSPVPRSENTVLEKLICWNIKELLHRVGITLQVTDLKWDLSKSKRPKDILPLVWVKSSPPKLCPTPCSTDFNTDFLLFLVLSPVRDDIIGLDKAPPEPQKTSSCCFNRAAAINRLSRQLLN